MGVERRAGVRYQDDTEVRILGTDNLRGRLSDLSIVGVRAVFDDFPEAALPPQLTMGVSPRQQSGIPAFELSVATVWKVRRGSSLEAGFRILASPNSADFEHYIDYLAFLHTGAANAD